MSQEQTKPEFFLRGARKFVEYYGALLKEHSSNTKWSTGHSIANEWLRLLDVNIPSSDEIDALIDKASEFRKSGGSGAIDMYSWLVKWKRWITQSQEP